MTRHGARIDKEDLNWLQKAGHQRYDDPHLSPNGERGARELANRLATHDIRVRYVVTSPFLCCVQEWACV